MLSARPLTLHLKRKPRFRGIRVTWAISLCGAVETLTVCVLIHAAALVALRHPHLLQNQQFLVVIEVVAEVAVLAVVEVLVVVIVVAAVV